MRSNILTILPHPSQRQAGNRLPAPGGAEATASVPRLPEALPSIESVLLQRMLAELEHRNVAHVQPTYVIDQFPAARRPDLTRTLWSLLWGLSLVVCVLSVKYIDSQTMVSRSDAAQSRAFDNLTASIGDQRKEFSTVAESLRELASAIALSSTRTQAIPDLLSQLRAEVPQPSAPVTRKPMEPPAETALPEGVDPTPIPMGSHHHAPIEYATVAPPSAIVHHNAAGVMDYWLVPRVVSGVPAMVQVVPVSQTSSGTLVHAVAEVKDYLLTASGDWIAVPEAR
jgi:hypothetical protein